jgi:hypothetical protein
MNQSSLSLIAICLLASCSTVAPTPLTTDNPASPSAPEAAEHSVLNTLAADSPTKKTHRIFAQADKLQEQPSPTSQPQETD